MFEQAGHIFPGLVVLMLALLANHAFRARNILLLDHFLSRYMLLLELHRVFFRHGDHFETLLVLSLSPLGEGRTTVTPPEHLSDLGEALVLVPGQLLVTSELSDVLEALLPD